MRARIRGDLLVLVAEDSVDAVALRQAAKIGHLHFCCKELVDDPKKRHGPELYLAPSLVRWQRPQERARKPR